MSQSQVILSDNNVSRLIADKAMHNCVFKAQLLGYNKPKNLRVVIKSIETFREQIVDQAGLKAPPPSLDPPRDLNDYLKRNMISRALVWKIKAEEGTEVASSDSSCEWGWVGFPKCIANLAIAFLQSTLRFQADPSPFPFQRLLPELRLQVYHEALRGASYTGIARATSITVTQTRTKGEFRFGSPIKGQSKEINVGLLTANKLVNSEAIAILYQNHTFDFKTRVGGIVPFLSGLSEQARQNLRGIKMELHDNNEPDHCCGHDAFTTWGKGPDNQAAWRKACVYIADNVNVKMLSLIIDIKVPANFKFLGWVKDLVKIKKLKSLMLEVIQHGGSGPVVVRASYKEGSVSATDHCVSEHLVPFFEYLREEMLE